MRRTPEFLLTSVLLALVACSSRGNTGEAATDAGGADTAVTDAPRVDAPATDARTDGAPVDAGTSRAGAACTSAAECGPRLQCDTDVIGGYCTATCMQNASQAAEQAQCGGAGSTCLTLNDPPDDDSICAQACDPAARGATGPGTCRAGYVCTGWWFTHENLEPDRPGCAQFCTRDAECTGGMRCNVRTGECGASGHDPARRADGEPCNPDDRAPCRGDCYITGTDTQGICGSLVNLRTTPRCPDTPEQVQALGAEDESGDLLDQVGLCLYRNCRTNDDCTAPLRCIPGMEMGEAPACDYPARGQTGIPGDGGTRTDAAGADATGSDAAVDAPRG